MSAAFSNSLYLKKRAASSIPVFLFLASSNTVFLGISARIHGHLSLQKSKTNWASPKVSFSGLILWFTVSTKISAFISLFNSKKAESMAIESAPPETASRSFKGAGDWPAFLLEFWPAVLSHKEEKPKSTSFKNDFAIK